MTGSRTRAGWKRRERERDDRRRYRGTHLRGPRRSPDHQPRPGPELDGCAVADAHRCRPHARMGAGTARRVGREPRRGVRGARRGRPVCGAGSAGGDHAGRLAPGAGRDFLTTRSDDRCSGTPARPAHAGGSRHFERASPCHSVRARCRAFRGDCPSRGVDLRCAGRRQGVSYCRRPQSRGRCVERGDLRVRRTDHDRPCARRLRSGLPDARWAR